MTPTQQNKPRLLDLFCGAGGAARGYTDAGFDVTGVDIVPQPRYPYTFILADAMTFPLDGYDAIHASPPCQHYSMMLNNNNHLRVGHPDLIGQVRAQLVATRKPYIIENVVGAPILNSIMLCGMMFGLKVYRHRRCESNILLFQPEHPKHLVKAAHASRIPRDGEFWSPVGCFGQKDLAQRAMGITWMKTTGSRDTEIAQAIPPAYTRWIGQFLLDAVMMERAGVA